MLRKIVWDVLAVAGAALLIYLKYLGAKYRSDRKDRKSGISSIFSKDE
jgi:threonine/homoserine/homoserine lactone efflux protein